MPDEFHSAASPIGGAGRHDYLPSINHAVQPALKSMLMGSVNIDAEDNTSIKEFEEGNSIQVRVTVSKEEKPEYDKGKKITVIHEGTEMTGRIVSDPIVIDRKRDDGKLTLSLIVEKD